MQEVPVIEAERQREGDGEVIGADQQARVHSQGFHAHENMSCR